MSGTKGYGGYHGRSNRNKKWITAVLMLVILLAVGYLVLQDYIVYDGAGKFSVILPNRAEMPSVPVEDVDIEVQPPIEPEKPVRQLKVLHATQMISSALKVEPASVLETADDDIIIEMKRHNGVIAYDTKLAIPEIVAVERKGSLEHLDTILTAGHYSIARISALCDSSYVRHDKETAMRLRNGGLWYDGDGGWAWFDPTNATVLGYMADLCEECASLGFDEILLDYFSYPLKGNMQNIANLTSVENRCAALVDFANALREKLPEEVALSVVLRSDVDEEYGISVELLTECFDRVYVSSNVDIEALRALLPDDYDQETRIVPVVAKKSAEGGYAVIN